MTENKKPAQEDDRGLRCGQCGSRKFAVIYTRAARNKTLIRRRECRNCGTRLTTWERQIGCPAEPSGGGDR